MPRTTQTSPDRGIIAWCVRRPVGVVMLALAVVVLGLFAFESLRVDLLPKIIQPEIRVRVLDANVPARIMEDQVTRQLEEQLAITENAIGVRSHTRQGRTSVDLEFDFGTDIDIALREASTRLDRAKRFLPDSIEPPIIYKLDPSQRPALSLIVSSDARSGTDLRDWTDDVLRKWLINVPGVAAAEVGGGRLREIQVIPDLDRLGALGMDVNDLADLIRKENRDIPAGRLIAPGQELSGYTAGRVASVQELAALPVHVAGGQTVRLADIARIRDGAEDSRLSIRLDGRPGVKLSIQKQPQANTVEVVAATRRQLDWLGQQGLVPDDIQITAFDDQSVFIRHAVDNAISAALTGAALAILVVYLFLGDLRRTLIIATAMPIAVLVTFTLLAGLGLTLNIMTLGGLALGIGMLVDSTIVMLENIARRQQTGSSTQETIHAAQEVASAIFASTSTNLAAVLPFLFIGGLVGLVFRELIFTISAAILASMLVALTLVPALAGRINSQPHRLRRAIDRLIGTLQNGYAWLIGHTLRFAWLVIIGFVAAAAWFIPPVLDRQQSFLPRLDQGIALIRIKTDLGMDLASMDRLVQQVEALLQDEPQAESVFTTVGGFVYGRSSYETSNRASVQVLLRSPESGDLSTGQWAAAFTKKAKKLRGPGVQIRAHAMSLRTVRLHSGDDDISVRINGPNLDRLQELGDQLVARLAEQPSLTNVEHSAEAQQLDLVIRIDRERVAALGFDVETVGRAVQVAFDGIRVSDFIDGDRAYDVRLQIDRSALPNAAALDNIVLYTRDEPRRPVRLGALASAELSGASANIHRDKQRRMVEVSAALAPGYTLPAALAAIDNAVQTFALPPGYTVYEGGSADRLQKTRNITQRLLWLALFLVFVVMAVQYESLRNPFVILLGVPFALIGVALGITTTDLPLSMPVALGVIMLTGIVVNNAIVLVEYIEILRREGAERVAAIIEAARLRLRPILMTTLTTVFGMWPLAHGWGAGSELLQPLAIVIIWGLGFALIVSLLLIPSLYRYLGRPDGKGG